MDFSFSEEQRAIRETAQRFAKERIAPEYKKREEAACLNRHTVREMGELGLIAVDLAEAYGGLGADAVTAGIIIEVIAQADLSMSYVLLGNGLMGSIIAKHGQPEVARELLPRATKGEIVIALGLTEPRGGSDAAGLMVKASRNDGGYLINGEKTSSSAADQSEYMVVLARTGTVEEKAGGVSGFVVPLDSPGVSLSRFDDMGTVAIGRGSAFFDDVQVSESMRLGQEGDGFRLIMNGFDYSRALIGLQCLGPARASLDETWEYVSQRQAFAKPIAAYQGVTQPLAEAETLMEAARLLCYKTLWLRDRGLPHTAEAAMCKWWVPQVTFDIIQRCLITHGHYGYAKDLPHQQRLRDVLGLQIGDGTEQIQKMVISREKIGRIAVPY